MTRIISIMAAIALVCGFSMEPILPEPMPAAMTAGAVLDVPAEDLEMLACVIYQEAGGDECSDECRIDVGDVVLTRVLDPRFPDTLEGVLTAPGQYGRFSTTGIVWPARAKHPGEKHAVERAYEIARQLLSGNHGDLWGQGYVWQAEFEQGTEGFWLDGIFFGR
jgi:Cell wall hydrolyses involved in spore germination